MDTIEIEGKSLAIRLSPRAREALGALHEPLLAEMELYFSCLIRKVVRFRPFAGEPDAVALQDKLYVRLRPVVSRACGAKVAEGPPPLDDMPLVNPGAYTPDWLAIDYRQGRWEGRFGYGTP